MFINEVVFTDALTGQEWVIALDRDTLFCGNSCAVNACVSALDALFLPGRNVDTNGCITAKFLFPDIEDDAVPICFKHLRSQENENLCCILEFDSAEGRRNWLPGHKVKVPAAPQELAGIGFLHLTPEIFVLRDAAARIMRELLKEMPPDEAAWTMPENFPLFPLFSNFAGMDAEDYIQWILSGWERSGQGKTPAEYLKLLQKLLIFRQEHLRAGCLPYYTLVVFEDIMAEDVADFIGATGKIPSLQTIAFTHSGELVRSYPVENIRIFHQGKVSPLLLPDDEMDKKFLLSLLKLFPGLLSAGMVIFTPSADIGNLILNFAAASGRDFNGAECVILPIAGNKMELSWQLLDQLHVPYITVMELEHQHPEGDWRKIAGILRAGKNCGKGVPAASGENSPVDIEALAGVEPDLASEKIWLDWLEENWSVFVAEPQGFYQLIAEEFAAELSALNVNPEGNLNILLAEVDLLLSPEEKVAREPEILKKIISRLRHMQS